MSELMKRTLLIIVAGMMSNAVQAANLNISGTVVANPCTVDTGSVSQYVDFQQVHKSQLIDVGSSTDWKSFQVKLTNCPEATEKATVTFSGTPAPEAPLTMFANASTATNVAVQMAPDAVRTQFLGNGSTMVVDIDAQHNAVYNLAGRLVSVNGSAGPGDFSSIVLMNFTYQ